MLGTLIFVAALGAADDAELLETLEANWESQRSAIATAHFRARAFRSGNMEPLSGQEVDAAFAKVDLAERPDDLRKLVPMICKHKEFLADPWAMVEISADGSKLRERTVNSPGALDDNVVDGGITVIGMGGANQTNILRTSNSKWRLRKTDDFRFIPVGAGLNVFSRDAGRVRLADSGDPHAELEVDEATGFVHSWRFFLEDGLIAQEVLQFGPLTYPGDLVLPKAIAKLSFRGPCDLAIHLW